MKFEFHVYRTYFQTIRFLNQVKRINGCKIDRTKSEAFLEGSIIKSVTEKSFSAKIRGHRNISIVKFNYIPTEKEKQMALSMKPKKLVIINKEII